MTGRTHLPLAPWVAHVRRQGRAVVIAVLAWGASITAFGLVRSLPVALVLSRGVTAAHPAVGPSPEEGLPTSSGA